MEYRIAHYPLEQGALEIQYIEEFFGEYQRRKTVSEIVGRLENRDHLILMAMAPLPDDPGSVVPVSYKVAHEIRAQEDNPKLKDLVVRLRDHVRFEGRRICVIAPRFVRNRFVFFAVYLLLFFPKHVF